MVADARHLTQEEVKQILARVKVQYGRDPEYIALRGRLPPSFPI